MSNEFSKKFYLEEVRSYTFKQLQISTKDPEISAREFINLHTKISDKSDDLSMVIKIRCLNKVMSIDDFIDLMVEFKSFCEMSSALARGHSKINVQL